jgi:AcrR family transcriptional regulator
VDPGRRASIEADVLLATERLLGQGIRFTELGVQRIAAEAGVARSTFYVHFRDKTDLLVRLTGPMLHDAFEIVGTWEIDGGPDGLADTLLAVIRFYRERAAVLSAINEVAGYDPVVRDVLDAQIAEFAAAGARRLAQEQAAGRTPADLDAVVVSRVIVWGGYRVIVDQVVNGDADGDAAIARELAYNQWYGAFRRPAMPV